jgi:hypothetical protein
LQGSAALHAAVFKGDSDMARVSAAVRDAIH